MKTHRKYTATVAGTLPLLIGATAFAANHREAPITALDHKADITDVFAFRSYDGDADPSNDPESVTLIMCVDPFLEPSNGPNFFPFDDEINYEIKIDNDNDAEADVTFQFRFTTTQGLPNVFTTIAGVGTDGAVGPGTAGDGEASGTDAPNNLDGDDTRGVGVVPPQVTSFDSAGLGQKQTYTVTMITDDGTTDITNGEKFAVPGNVGPRTMDYEALFTAATYTAGLTGGISSFAGTVDDPFWIDLGAVFDTVNLNTATGPAPGVMSAENDAAAANVAPDYVAGNGVNAIAIEVPISMLQAATGDDGVDNTIGVWATTSRPRVTVRRAPFEPRSSGTFRQIQRMANPLINEAIIGTGMKNRFSMDQPVNDAQFAAFVLDPVLARVANALYGGVLGIPAPPRTDLFPLVQYSGPFAGTADTPGPIADLLRLRLDVPATPVADSNRLGFLFGDTGGFPNGRRLFDDVTDIALRVVIGGILNPGTDEADGDYYTAGINNMLGDGVNVNDVPYRTAFPYLGSAPSGNAPAIPAN